MYLNLTNLSSFLLFQMNFRAKTNSTKQAETSSTKQAETSSTKQAEAKKAKVCIPICFCLIFIVFILVCSLFVPSLLSFPYFFRILAASSALRLWLQSPYPSYSHKRR